MADARLEFIDVDAGEAPAAIAVATLDRPSVANSFSVAMIEELHDALDVVQRTARVRVFVVTGAERHFSGGGDLREGRSDQSKFVNRVRQLFVRISDLRQPTIAAINGAAAGGGCELALACDLRIIDETARIGLPEVRFGSVACAGGTQRLPRLVGAAKALELNLLGELITAQEAGRIGLVNAVVPAGTALQRALEQAAVIASRPRLAVETATYLVRESQRRNLADGLALEVETAAVLDSNLRGELRNAAERDPLYERIVGDGAPG
jgi:enoyl-CoA hydratase/carnithine racemase